MFKSFIFAVAALVSTEAGAVTILDQTQDLSLTGSEWLWIEGGGCAADCKTTLNAVASFAATFSTPAFAGNAALSALPSTYAQWVARTGYATAGDSPVVLYKPGVAACSLNGGAGDGGSQVPTSDGKCWLAQFAGPVDFSVFGGGITTYADTPFVNWTAALIAANLPGTVAQAGTYNFASPPFFDVSNAKRYGLRIQGGGCNATKFNYTGSSVPAFRVGADTAGAVSGLNISGGAASQGSGYDGGGTATYTSVPLTGGAGTGAVGTVVVTGGVVTSITVTSGGSGYLVGDALTASAANLGNSGGSGLSALVRGDNFYTSIKGLSFVGNVNGPLVQWGRNDMLDTINGSASDNCENNSSTGASAEQVRVNSVVTSAYFANVASGPGASNGHSACEVRGASMVNFFGSCSGMAAGMHVTATTAQAVFGNSFHTVDGEVDGKALLIDNSGGAAPTKNTWIGGQWAYATCAVDATTGSNNLIVNGNLGGVNDYCNRTGIVTIGASYNADTNVAFQAFGVNATTGVAAWPTYGSNSGINFNNGTAYFSNQATGAANSYAVTGTGTHYWYVGATNVLLANATSVAAKLPLQTMNYTISGLPTCGAASVGQAAYITNGIAAPTYHQAVSATGAAAWLVSCSYNGTTYGWVY